MSKKTPQQNLPHYGVKNGLRRSDHVITGSYTPIIGTTARKTFMPKGVEPMPAGSPSISEAKRYMRTGSFK